MANTPYADWGPVLQSGGLGAEEPEDSTQVDVSLADLPISAPRGAVSFYYRVSSERGFDVLRFLVDGVEQRTNGFPRSGLQTGWRLARFRLQPGRRTITWRFEKDAFGRAGDDVAYVSVIEVRNAAVQPVTMAETLRVTHIGAGLETAQLRTKYTAADVLGIDRDQVSVSISEVFGDLSGTGNPGGSGSPQRRLQGSQQDAQQQRSA